MDRNNQIKEARKRASSIRRRAMTDPVANPTCQVCGFSYPPVMHLHHVHPLAESAKISDDHVWLCPNCHAMAHEIRRVFYSNKRHSNAELRHCHLHHWLENCPTDIVKKLYQIAKGQWIKTGKTD